MFRHVALNDAAIILNLMRKDFGKIIDPCTTPVAVHKIRKRGSFLLSIIHQRAAFVVVHVRHAKM